MHANYVVATGALCTDAKTEQSLAGPVTEINSRLLTESIDIAKFWDGLLDETVAGNDKACEIALFQAGCSEMQLELTTSIITNRLSECRQAFQSRFPKLDEQLKLRARPIRDQWDSFGAGLLAKIASQIWEDSPPSDWWPARVSGLLVQPMRGGDGGIAPHAEQFWIEAMLTDADPGVPEVLRVAWLNTKLALDLHLREKSTERTALPWTFGLVPIVLSAGKHLDLIKSDTLPIESAVDLWRVADQSTARIIADWWEQWRSSPSPMPVGLKLLEHMLTTRRDAQIAANDSGLDVFDLDE